MIVRVKHAVMGASAYLAAVGAAYWYTVEEARKARATLEKLEGEIGTKNQIPKQLSEEERLKVFREGAKEYDQEIGTDETVMGLNLIRWWLVSKARGDVLEVAGGTGRNLTYYPRGSKLTIIDLCDGMVAETEKKLRAMRKGQVTFGVMDAAKMTFKNQQFDTVVDTFGLCSFEDPVKALQEMRRVCKEDGQILLLEHGRSHYDWLNRILDMNACKHTERWGCIWNRDIAKLVEEAGLEVKLSWRFHFGTTYYIIAQPAAKEKAAQAATIASKQ